ncbi:MAG: putative zinc-binding metallopeptidase [Capnocytophaga sp.]|nr:putative zinc-binding metallopeptidase [Capnocytophaga sp.]
MKKYIKDIAFGVVVILMSACSAEDKPDAGTTVIALEDDLSTKFDVFLKREYVDTYNIQFMYKMVDAESDMNYTLVPATYANSVKMANLVKYLCLEPYNAVAPDNFLKLYFPKMIMMVGSPAYRNNGTMVLGTAEGGLKITLYNINGLNVNNLNTLYEYYFRTIYHEFSHILHQTKDFPNDFRMITPAAYVGDSWNTISEVNARRAGFISPYSMKESNEDFVELIAYYITYTDAQWTAALTAAGTTGAPIIQQKIEIVKNYLLASWDIDLDALKAEVQTRAANLSNVDLDNID